jgi:flagella basal body P-ring formation protein FlgA
MTPLPTLALAACIAIGPASDQVVVRDLAPAFESSAAPLPDSAIALAPAPGIERRFEFAELRRIAVRFNLGDPVREVCVCRPVAPLDPARVMDAMRTQLPVARIELLDSSRQMVPEGVLEFPLSGLRQAAAGAFWSGSLQYGGRHHVSVWARVDVLVSSPRVVAVENLSPGRPIDGAALRVETRDEFPSTETSPVSIEEVAGKILRRPVAAGTSIRSVWLESPKAVLRGENVEIESREGAALVQAPGQAQGSGAIGETIFVLNATSKKRFPARITAKGKVAVGKGSL